jgi:hypothetical protein
MTISFARALFVSVSLTTLSACFSPVAKLPSGTSVHFHNTIGTEITVQRVGFTVFGNERSTDQVPELAPMMRRVVMEEAAKAGLRCTYTAGELPKKSQSAFEKFMIGDKQVDVESVILQSKTNVGFIAFPTGNAAGNRPTHLTTQGFAVEESKAPFMPASVSVIGGTSVMRYDRTATDKAKGRTHRHAGNFPFIFMSYQDKRYWKTALPSSRQRALTLWELQFRTAVAMIMGNPEPRLDPPMELKRL